MDTEVDQRQVWVKVVYARPDGASWNVITAMARLTARLLEADYVELPLEQVRTPRRQVLARAPRRRSGGALLVIAPAPIDLHAAFDWMSPVRGNGRVVAWVVDSWWIDRIPSAAAVARRQFDQIFVSELEDVADWRQATGGGEISWLPQGSNVLDWGSARADREVTVQRVGRQPANWDDDNEVAGQLARAGMTYAGRPPFHDDPEMGMSSLLDSQSRARFCLAFSNRIDRQSYTHPTREYLTGRWTDALASGCTVAGIPPRTESVERLLWPEALLEVSAVDMASGIEALEHANRAWRPQLAQLNHLRALERLDWRWRIKDLADACDHHSIKLEHELDRLRKQIEMVSGQLTR